MRGFICRSMPRGLVTISKPDRRTRRAGQPTSAFGRPRSTPAQRAGCTAHRDISHRCPSVWSPHIGCSVAEEIDHKVGWLVELHHQGHGRANGWRPKIIHFIHSIGRFLHFTSLVGLRVMRVSAVLFSVKRGKLAVCLLIFCVLCQIYRHG